MVLIFNIYSLQNAALINPSNFGAMRAAKFGVYRYPDQYMIVVPRGLFME
jgi:hypothetical protein